MGHNESGTHKQRHKDGFELYGSAMRRNEAEEEPHDGNEAILQKNKRHWRCREIAWIRFAHDHEWADGTRFPYTIFFDMFNVPVEAGIRVTAYQNFEERDAETALKEYDFIVINTPKGPAVHQYETHEGLRQANIKAHNALDRIKRLLIGEEGDKDREKED